MRKSRKSAGAYVHVRLRAEEHGLIGHAAKLIGVSRSYVMVAAALNEAKNVLLDRTTIYVDARAFQTILDWMERPPTVSEVEGMKKLTARRSRSAW
jgi:uncharacterized protein (DUF1778 family)